MLSSIAVEVRPEGERLRIVPWVKVVGVVLQVKKEEDGRYCDEDIQRRAITIACEHCKESTMIELPCKVASTIMQFEAFNRIHGYCPAPDQVFEADPKSDHIVEYDEEENCRHCRTEGPDCQRCGECPKCGCKCEEGPDL